MQALRRAVGSLATTIVLLVAWEVIAEYVYPRFVPTSRNIFPPPSAIVVTAWELLAHSPATEPIPLAVLQGKAARYRQVRTLDAQHLA